MSPPQTRVEPIRASSSDSIDSALTVDNLSNAQSSSSTPPTSIGDDASVSSSSLKVDNAQATSMDDSNERSRRVRTSVGTYNVKVLSGTAIHAPKKFANDRKTGNETRRRTISGDTIMQTPPRESSIDTDREEVGSVIRSGLDALDLEWSILNSVDTKNRKSNRAVPNKSAHNTPSKSALKNARRTAKERETIRRRATRSANHKVENLTRKLTANAVLGKRKLEDGLAKAKRDLRNLADTKEFAKIDTEPVVYEVWSKGKLVVQEPPRKQRKLDEEAARKEKERLQKEKEKQNESSLKREPKVPDKKRKKVWLNMGLYAGQDTKEFDWFKTYTPREKQQYNLPDLPKPNKSLPMPIWHGQRLLHQGRTFTLPFDVCSPLPPGQPKPDEWRKTSSNRFVGDAAALWKKSTLFDSFSSKCVCTPEGGCDVDCQNRTMLYECDDTNCGSGRGRCTNRAFATLQERRKGGGKYRIGVEVIKTADRGYGVRSNRCFEANQIIVEYTGEIITEEECDRRMNEDYKDNECYYLMSFDQNMIIDATKGSIARFVNHSCKPNCRMVKWIVGGKPRMALFAGDGPIMTGDELTYDYNFDPFSAKNVQECRCGSDNCRGVLGPRPKDQKPLKDSVKDTVKATVKAGKRKLKELLGGEDDVGSGARNPKKRKMKAATGVKRSRPSAGMKVTKGARAIKKGISNARQSNSRRGQVITIRKTTKSTIRKNRGMAQTKTASRNSSLTIVSDNISPRTGKPLRAYTKRSSFAKSIVRSVRAVRVSKSNPATNESTIKVILGDDEE